MLLQGLMSVTEFVFKPPGPRSYITKRETLYSDIQWGRGCLDAHRYYLHHLQHHLFHLHRRNWWLILFTSDWPEQRFIRLTRVQTLVQLLTSSRNTVYPHHFFLREAWACDLLAGPLEGRFLHPYHRSQCLQAQQGQNHRGYYCLVALVPRSHFITILKINGDFESMILQKKCTTYKQNENTT